MSTTDLIKIDTPDDNNPDWDTPPTKPFRNPLVSNREFGDRGTWILIGLMCALGLTVALTAYLLPMGQHAAMPSIEVH